MTKKYTREDILRMAACIEEHFAHSIATAIVKQAEEEGIKHEEDHSEVEYIVAHGIATTYGDKRVVIGSRHFLFDDEGKTYATGSYGIYNALTMIFEIFGEPSKEHPIKVKVSKKATSNGHSTLTLVRVK